LLAPGFVSIVGGVRSLVGNDDGAEAAAYPSAPVIDVDAIASGAGVARCDGRAVRRGRGFIIADWVGAAVGNLAIAVNVVSFSAAVKLHV
jgi:hypothetical protein